MREIKFRAWDKKYEDMLYSDVQTEEYEFRFTENGIEVYGYSDDFANPMDVELMQFTGLYDKHHKPIYEWDIVKGFYDEYNTYFNETNRIEFISDVKWINNGFGVRRLTANYEGRLKDYGYQLFWDAENVEVIGNIFEDKHLLEC